MIRFFMFVTLLVAVTIAKADDYIEAFNAISDNYVDNVQDVKIIRPINGGTVITPVFDESCPEEVKSPFLYACKIVEEYLPPCLPLKVEVSCGQVNSSSPNTLSKVLTLSEEKFGSSTTYNHAQMSVIKGVIWAELSAGSRITYLDYVPDINFLMDSADIKIVYNSQKFDEISFSLEPNPGQKYDFVSLAVRDLLIGLGLSSSYRYNPVTNTLLNPSQEFTPFEYYIDKMLGNYGNEAARLEQATKGELLLKQQSIKSLKLYAPSPWKNGMSLNYFIPQEDCCVSNILSYDFCKGMVTRSLADDYSNFIFHDLLGWKASILTGSPSSTPTGSTSVLMPYNGSIFLDDYMNGVNKSIDYSVNNTGINMLGSTASENLEEFVYSFIPSSYIGNGNYNRWMSISVLKKDGTWDMVKYGGYVENIPQYMADWKFNYDESEYARTIDGYLRGSVTIKTYNDYGYSVLGTQFFVIDYLPQKVNLSYTFVNSSSVNTKELSADNKVRIYFSNIEGLDRLVLEKLRQGSRIPSKIDVTDFKKGYYETTAELNTTFTAVGYNANGTSKGQPITISLTLTALPVNFTLTDNSIIVESENQLPNNYNYTITPMDLSVSQGLQTGSTTGVIDISTLPEGCYVVTVEDGDTHLSNSFKFKK